jgi:hypothetical protein
VHRPVATEGTEAGSRQHCVCTCRWMRLGPPSDCGVQPTVHLLPLALVPLPTSQGHVGLLQGDVEAAVVAGNSTAAAAAAALRGAHVMDELQGTHMGLHGKGMYTGRLTRQRIRTWYGWRRSAWTPPLALLLL